MLGLGAVLVIDVHALAARAPAFDRLHFPALAERLIGELFGWELAHDTKHAEAVAPSILPPLLSRYLRGDPVTANYPALAPSPEVDRCLGRLVQIARCEFEEVRAPMRDRAVSEQILLRIQGEPELALRARTLRNIAAVAESEMEHHWSDRLLAALRTTRSRATAARAGPERLRRLAAHLSRFPYIANYAHLVRAELALLRCVQFVSRETSFAVIGCGPLPITGLMLHAYTGARVTLVDRDARSIERSAALVCELERLRVSAKGAVRTLHADAVDPAAWAASSQDVALVASLVPNTAKLQLARALSAAGSSGPGVLMMRSAVGLCAELVYEPVPTREIASDTFAFCGASVPAHLPARDVPLALAHASVLNTTELYHARTVHGLEQPCPKYDRNDCCS